jgi:uncharacterized OsmC-like protein
MNAQTKIAPTISDTRELRAFLVEQMHGVANGRVNSEKAKSIANLSQQIYNTLNIEVKLAISKAKLNGQTVDAVSFVD